MRIRRLLDIARVLKRRKAWADSGYSVPIWAPSFLRGVADVGGNVRAAARLYRRAYGESSPPRHNQ